MKMFITGGAGFVGCNCADHFLGQGHEVVIYDNLSRAGGPANLAWLHGRHDRRLRFIQGDVRDAKLLATSMQGAEAVLHLASQVAVTTSVENPREDFEINAWGTFNVLEAVRHQAPEAAFLYASSNKVYGGMEEVKVVQNEQNYKYADFAHGVPETFPLDFHSPYGCSKGAGDQYVRDYHRIYDLPTVVFRQSCIYGERQFGVEDQGWLAWFIIATHTGKPITIYGDGKQVRDVLYIDDLLDSYDLAVEKIDQVAGEVFNIGGGASNTLSVWSEFGPLLERLEGREIPVKHSDWRPGDQKIYVSDIRKAEKLLGWTPKTGVVSGIEALHKWVSENNKVFAI